jgi:hypothetical protein
VRLAIARPDRASLKNGEVPMAFKNGEVYRCPDAGCACELTVTKEAPPNCEGTQAPTCCCGRTMVLVED